ncbi:MAG: CAP domain-containing protein [Acidimicrobiia bacterium]
MRTIRRVLTLALTSTVLVAGLAIPAHAGPEGTLVSRINSSRAAAGKAPLQTYWDLTDDARAHASAMRSKGSIYHSSNLAGVTSGWEKLGENVGVGVDANSLHDGFMASSSHRSNILGDYNYVGVGVKADDDGLIWVTVIFMRAAPGLNGGGETTTTTVAPTTTTTTVPPPADPSPSTPSDPVPETTTTTTTTGAPKASRANTGANTQAKAAPAAQKASSAAAPIVGFGHSPLLRAIAD